jgi:dGTPase
LVETAALAHDLGHPPFGHNGEKALDDVMKDYGGFEGNAQTLRILTKLEKKTTLDQDFIPVKNGYDRRNGLNLCYRTLAAILKYDSEIPLHRKPEDTLLKGYYYTEKDIVEKIRLNVLGNETDKPLKTIECQIMDIADDIAYSTYDLEDAFKGGFLSPLGILSSKEELINKVAEAAQVSTSEVHEILGKTYGQIFDEERIKDLVRSASESGIIDPSESTKLVVTSAGAEAFDFSERICTNGYFRTAHTSSLVNEVMAGVEVGEVDDQFPALAKVRLNSEIQKEVEIRKRYTYCAVIESSRLKVTEFRGYDIVKEIFETLIDEQRKGYNLLPDDYRQMYEEFQDEGLKKRVICDFIAGMTDRYAVEFYARLKSETPQTIFKPF